MKKALGTSFFFFFNEKGEEMKMEDCLIQWFRAQTLEPEVLRSNFSSITTTLTLGGHFIFLNIIILICNSKS